MSAWRPTCVEKKMIAAAAATSSTTANTPAQWGRAATSANVARGDVRTPSRRPSSPRCAGAAGLDVAMVSVMLILLVDASSRNCVPRLSEYERGSGLGARASGEYLVFAALSPKPDERVLPFQTRSQDLAPFFFV